jgi:RNA polymerase sporulation-specific sigma factor
MEHTLALIGRAHQGDKEARDTLFEENTGLIYSVARRFLGRGVEMEDLFQIGSIGLLKAVDKFDPAFEVKFSTYAIPMILGELKRFFRDDGMIKVSRSIKENQHRVYLAREKIEKELGREPSLKEIAEMLEMPPEEVAMTMDSAAEVESLYRTVYQSEGTDISLIDKIPEKENAEEHLLNRIFLEEILGKLESSDRKLLYMRYFQDQTQTQIAEQLGVSQVQVSRMEKRILKKLRSLYQDG